MCTHVHYLTVLNMHILLGKKFSNYVRIYTIYMRIICGGVSFLYFSLWQKIVTVILFQRTEEEHMTYNYQKKAR